MLPSDPKYVARLMQMFREFEAIGAVIEGPFSLEFAINPHWGHSLLHKPAWYVRTAEYLLLAIPGDMPFDANWFVAVKHGWDGLWGDANPTLTQARELVEHLGADCVGGL